MANRCCYYIMQTEVDENGNFVPAIVKENERGFYRTDWQWGNNLALARQFAKEKNEALGLTDEDVERIICSSMFPMSN